MHKSPCRFCDVILMSYMRSLCLVMSQTYCCHTCEFTCMIRDLSRICQGDSADAWKVGLMEKGL